MEYILSKHAFNRLKERGITLILINKVILEPDKIIYEDNCTQVYQKKLDNGDKIYLYRVYDNSCKQPNLIITAFKTSKLNKYEN